MKENQNLRYELLKASNYDVKNAKACYDFVAGNEQPEVNADNKEPEDGIYLIDTKGNAVRFVGDETETLNDTAYIGVVMGKRSVAVALKDAADCKDTTLTAEAEEEDCADSIYYDGYRDAVADFNGKQNTENLKAQGLSKAIDLQDDEYIPSLGELYLIVLNRKAINKALEFVGGQPIKGLWYWSSTESSATYAWTLNLNNGYAGSYPKATATCRVRPVSAFLR